MQHHLFVLSVLSIATARADLLTFDDLPSMEPVTNGYGGLQWNGFTAVSSADFPFLNPPFPPGFLNGLVSGSTIVYNTTNRCTISSGSLFDLDSAYLTAAMADTQIEILGYAGTNLLYNQTYSLTSSASSLINFNYQNIDQVVFSGGDFVMDNLSITPHTQTLQPGSLEFSSPTYVVGEGGLATIMVNGVGGSTGTISVQVATSDATGTNGVNYT